MKFWLTNFMYFLSLIIIILLVPEVISRFKALSFPMNIFLISIFNFLITIDNQTSLGCDLVGSLFFKYFVRLWLSLEFNILQISFVKLLKNEYSNVSNLLCCRNGIGNPCNVSSHPAVDFQRHH